MKSLHKVLFTACVLFVIGFAYRDWDLFTNKRKALESIQIVTNSTRISPQTEYLVKKTRLLCWIMADPDLLHTKVIHQKNTWGRKCDKLLVMSSSNNDTFPAIGMNVPKGKDHIAAKVTAAWKYIHKHHISEYDFFIKTDPDTYVVVENVRDFLKDKEPTKPYYYGHGYKPINWNFTYMAGGPGLLLTKESLNRLVSQAFVQYPDCIVDGQGEDWKVCKCLALVGCEPQNVTDSEGKEIFHVLQIWSLIFGKYPDWYRDRDVHGSQQGSQCCSDYPLSFHYIKPQDMYVLEYWLYHAKVKGLETQKVPWPKIDPVSE